MTPDDNRLHGSLLEFTMQRRKVCGLLDTGSKPGDRMMSRDLTRLSQWLRRAWRRLCERHVDTTADMAEVGDAFPCRRICPHLAYMSMNRLLPIGTKPNALPVFGYFTTKLDAFL